MYKIVKEQGEVPQFDPDVLGPSEDKISTVVDVREYLSQKLAALNCHQSQMNPNSIIRRMPEEMRVEAMGYENLQREEIIGIHVSKADLVVKRDFYGFLLMMENLSPSLLLATSSVRMRNL